MQAKRPVCTALDDLPSISPEFPAKDSCCEGDGVIEGVTGRLQLAVAGVVLCCRMYLSILLVLAHSALAPGLIRDANLLPNNTHIKFMLLLQNIHN